MSFFDESLHGMDPEALRASIEQMKADVKQEVADEFYSKEEGEFIVAAIGNLAEELKGITSFENLQIKQKARILAFMSFIYDVLEQDEDFDDEDFEEEDEELEMEDDSSHGKKGKKIESFPE